MQEISTVEGMVPYGGKETSGIKVSDDKHAAHKSYFNRGHGENTKSPHLMWQILMVSVWATSFGLVLSAMEFIHSGRYILAITHLIDVWLWGLLVPFLLT